MVDKPRKVAHLSLEDLVRTRASASYHHVDALDAICYEAGKFTDSGAAFDILGVLVLARLEMAGGLHSAQ